MSADGWATGEALFDAPSWHPALLEAPPSRPREARCARCRTDLLYLETAPAGPHLCTSCRRSTTPAPT